MINGALAIVGMFVALMFGGFAGMWAIWPTAYRHGYAEGESDRHRHRRGDPAPGVLVALPHSGRLAVEPDPDDWRIDHQAALEPPWLFAGESAPGWGSESAEYELLTQTTEQPVSVTGEPPIDTGELLAITDRVESWIAQWTAQGNVDRHTIQAGD